MSERIVHLCGDDPTADGLALAELPGELRVFSDDLGDGPLLPLDDDALRARRAAHRAARGDGDGDGDGDGERHLTRLVADDRAATELAGAEELILWVEHDLDDQLALVRNLARLARRGLPPQVSMVSIDRHPEVPGFTGLAQLTPTQLAALWPRRTPIGRDALDEAVAAWVAVTASNPRALPFVARRARALPFLGGALERALEEFPDLASGLARSERQLLAAVARGERDGRALLAAVNAMDPRYPRGARGVVTALADLAAAGLVTGAAPRLEEATDLAVTERGRAALAAVVDRVAEGGIDTWRGGVHLVGRGPVWRWDGRERRLVER